MTSLLTIPQEMFFVVLTMVLFATLVGDFRNARLFRNYRSTPNPWKDLSKNLKFLMVALCAYMAMAADKTNLMSRLTGGERLPGENPESVEGGRYSLLEGGGSTEDASGITWALRTALPPFTSNAFLTASQFTGGFACVAVTNIQPSALDAPANALALTNWPYAVARQSVLLPQGCLPEGFTFGGRTVTNLYMSASGMLSFDSPKSSPSPATNGIPDGTAANYISVLQTPSDIVPTNGLFWYAPGTNSSVFTWKDVYLGRDTNCLATVQAELYANGDFTCRYLLPSPTNNYAAITNCFLIGAQNNGGGETVLHTNAFLAINPSFLPAFELRWKSLAGLSPNTPDYDYDGLSDADELFIYHTSVRQWDTDNDGLSDGEEVLRYGTDPLKPDSLGDGTNDFWRVVDPESLTNTPWMEGGDGLALLTLETRLDGVESGLAALRIGDTLVPVVPGTSRVCRVSFPCNVSVPLALIPAPDCPQNASASVTVVASDAPGILRDPDGIFTIPQSGQQRAYSLSSRLSSSPVSFPVKTATGVLIKCTLDPDPLCPHTGNGTLSNIMVRALLPSDGATAVGLVEDDSDTTPEPTLTVTEERLLEMYPALSAEPPGVYHVAFTALVYAAAAPGYTSLPPVRRTITAHYCVFNSGAGEDTHPDGVCPCCTSELCPCRCLSKDVCTCAVCRDPYHVNAPTNSVGQPIGTTDRDHRLLLAGGAPDKVFAGPQSGDGSSSTGKCAYCQCQQHSAPYCLRPAWVWRQTTGLASSPASLSTNGFFTVTGGSPSEAIGGDVFTWKAGPTYSRGRYTVAGLGVVFPYAVPDTVPRVQLGQTNDLLVTTQIPTNNTGTISFPGIFFIANNISVKNRQTGVYDALLSSYDVATWRAFYLTEEQTAELHYVATAVVPYGFTVKYELTDTTPTSVTNNLAFEAIRIQSEPVTSELATGGFVYNPSGMPLGSDARFKIAIADGAVPEEDITWTVTSGAGCVSFVNDNNAGPDIAIHADSVGDFTLEVNVKGLVITPPNVRPCFSGKVLPAVNVPVTVFIVRDNFSNNVARASTEIPGLLDDANKILKQRGITLLQAGTNIFLNNTAWLNHTNALAETNVVIDAMMNSTNSLGQAVELYFVQSLTAPSLAGVRRAKGIALANVADARVLAHEVLHDCTEDVPVVEDIYPVRNDLPDNTDPVTGPACMERLPADWGGGYYPPGLSQRSLINRLIMRSGGYDEESGVSLDLPFDSIWGYRDSVSNGVTVRVLGMSAVGQAACKRNPGSY